MQKEGFTLIELLIVIAIIGIIMIAMFIALNPLLRFQHSRDAVRWQEVSEMLTAIKVDQIDNDGEYMAVIEQMSTSTVYLIGTCVNGATAVDITNYCDVNPAVTACINFVGFLTEGYMGSLPVSPAGAKEWTSEFSGYTIEKRDNGTLFLRACESEQADEIVLSR
ncbi:prepilin-type N-terminal cleavage/methylation domain-containing protein [Patescibacteria group bacterium]|nr:prepilin-type N-terminal cleavage/methylation domain-containing protein [Patescibacteria group bacterium]MBU1721171.1 prepilin-type N-terminal cleavage/methylation domain-containing protein [Patescibacteria group bacterium]MBU1900899.1 prepilin-type N-terminal cleavage/methylation domain-containing protein [Patescibacteria group bacterium]